MAFSDFLKKDKAQPDAEEELDSRAAELQKQADGLDRRQGLLEQRESSVAVRASLHEQQRDAFAAQEQELAARTAALAQAEAELARRELNAAAGFAEQQREAFAQIVELDRARIAQWQADLARRQDEMTQLMSAAVGRDGELARREFAVVERELRAEAGFAEKGRDLLAIVAAREAAAAASAETCERREAALSEQHAALLLQAGTLRQREARLAHDEQTRDHGFAELRAALEQEFLQRRQEVERTLADLHATHTAHLDRELCDLRARRLDALREEEAAERTRWREDFAAERAQIVQAQQDLVALRGSLQAETATLQSRQMILKSRAERLQESEAALPEQAESLAADRRASYEALEQRSEEEKRRLRQSLDQQQALLGTFQELKVRLGNEDPEKVLLDLNSKTEQIRQLKQDLLDRPTLEMRGEFDGLKADRSRLADLLDARQREILDLQQRLRDEPNLRAEVMTLAARNQSLETNNKILAADCNQLTEKLRRATAAYEGAQERAARLRDIEIPLLKADDLPPVREDEIDEIQWLDGIENACTSYGLRFPRRLLEAFHTSLKIAEWSPLAVLAGVSGTGKSELPRLYAHFGGLNYQMLSVQPNWDSQEAMLGYFNSIDNKFDAQPVLRFLAQTQKKDSADYPGLEHCMNMILLDEMNLAHPEMYFAEFLSKLEYRRGTGGEGATLPTVDVKLGAGLEPFALRLGRNVLWAGTMNQDETTKSLSDKVLDRSTIVYFPRPVTLERRRKMMKLPRRSSLLTFRQWNKWRDAKSPFGDEEIQPYKSFIEDINTSLSKVGRALGHRVWQSIEYYLANHPRVRAARQGGEEIQKAAMHRAFEDQLVQKVMPKLRGIETRGRSRTECLNVIASRLDGQGYALREDFELACELGYGQFMWQTANYLRDEPGNSMETVGTLV